MPLNTYKYNTIGVINLHSSYKCTDLFAERFFYLYKKIVIFGIQKVENMKTIQFLSLLLVLAFLQSCYSVRIVSDYDKSVDYSQYKTYAFYKDGIDNVKIHDLDKKRILKAIEKELQAKGMTASENPDLLVNIFTQASERIDVNPYGYNWYFGWNYCSFGGITTSVHRYIEGTLRIDLIDANKKEVVWQGVGEGFLTKKSHKKEERINEFVKKIIEKYPPEIKK